MFWETYQQRAIHTAASQASTAQARATNLADAVHRMEEKIDSLALTCQALWELLRDRSDLTEEELIEKIAEIDLRDGKEDGRMGTGGAPCPRCNRVLSRRHERCMYCGEDVGKPHLFQQ